MTSANRLIGQGNAKYFPWFMRHSPRLFPSVLGPGASPSIAAPPAGRESNTTRGRLGGEIERSADDAQEGWAGWRGVVEGGTRG